MTDVEKVTHLAQLTKALRYIYKDGKAQGAVECPRCLGEFIYTKSAFNNFIHGRCTSCNLNFVQ